MKSNDKKINKRVVKVKFRDEKYGDNDIPGYLDELLGRLEKDVSKRFKEITSFEISEVSFKPPKTISDLKLNDEEFMLQGSFF